MEIKTFWGIIIKGIGLWLLIDCVYIIPQFAATFSFTQGQIDWENLITVWIITIGTLIVYLLATIFFLFKTEWLVKILRLDKGFEQKKIDLTISYKTVLSIAVVVIGALIFVEGIPKLCSSLYEFAKQNERIDSYLGAGWLIFYFLKTLFGYLIMTNSKVIVKFIDQQKGD